MKAVVLAGGKSSRMGENKALLPLGGIPMICRIANILEMRFSEVYISGASEDFSFLNMPVITDIYTEKGPIGGIFASLEFQQDDIFVCPCDMPFISVQIVDFLINNYNKEQISVVSYKDKIYPTLGIYPFCFKEKIEKYIIEGDLKMQRVLKDLDAKIINIPDSFSEDILQNINTKEQYENIKNKYF